jgi:uncharacterized protein (DUF1330 family)
MPTYMIVTIKDVKDRRSMEQYFEQVAPTFDDTGVKVLSAYTPFKIVEGEGPIDGMVLLEFPDMETANRWYDSPAYKAVAHHRLYGADTQIIFLEGGMPASQDDWMPHTKGRVREA